MSDFIVRKVGRRGFLKGLAAGGLLLVLDALLPPVAGADSSTMGAPVVRRSPTDPLVWVAIAPDGTASIMVARSEMGQGTRSTLVLAIADELEADIARVKVVQAVGDEKLYSSQNTDGSRSIRQDLDNLRRIGAAARQMLEAAAAALWQVPVGEVAARHHEVVHAKSGRKAGYGELAVAAWRQPVPVQIVLKDRKDMRIVGKPGMKAFDLDDMVRGRALFGIDVVRPGMKYAVIARPPVYGGKVAKFDDKATRATPGVLDVIELPAGNLPGGFRPLGGIAVIATNTWAAIAGRRNLKVTWNDGPNAKYDSITYRRTLEATTKRPAKVVGEKGDVAKALEKAHRIVKADYYVPHLAHVPMEPPVATAHVADGGCEVWAPSQHPMAARTEVAAALDIPIERVTVHVTLLGGGFGRKSKPDFIVEAALLSRAVGGPIKVQWTREDDLAHGYYHTVTAQHLEAALDDKGHVQGWLQRTAFPSILSTFVPLITHASEMEMGMGVTDLPYAIPAIRLENGAADPHVRIGWFRSVANIQHAFAVNSFVSELAAAARRDPKDFLLELLGDDRQFEAPRWNYGVPTGEYPVDIARLRRVVEVAAEKAGWSKAKRPGHGMGIAVHRSFLTYVATVVEVIVDAEGNLRIPKVNTAVDCGFAANPDRVRAQMEGSAVMGLSLAMHGAVTFREGRAEQSNFHDFPVVRMDAAPRDVSTWIVDSGGAIGGVGEPGVPPFAPALCNAIHAAIGKRIRSLPIANQLARSNT